MLSRIHTTGYDCKFIDVDKSHFDEAFESSNLKTMMLQIFYSFKNGSTTFRFYKSTTTDEIMKTFQTQERNSEMEETVCGSKYAYVTPNSFTIFKELFKHAYFSEKLKSKTCYNTFNKKNEYYVLIKHEINFRMFEHYTVMKIANVDVGATQKDKFYDSYVSVFNTAMNSYKENLIGSGENFKFEIPLEKNMIIPFVEQLVLSINNDENVVSRLHYDKHSDACAVEVTKVNAEPKEYTSDHDVIKSEFEQYINLNANAWIEHDKKNNRYLEHTGINGSFYIYYITTTGVSSRYMSRYGILDLDSGFHYVKNPYMNKMFDLWKRQFDTQGIKCEDITMSDDEKQKYENEFSAIMKNYTLAEKIYKPLNYYFNLNSPI